MTKFGIALSSEDLDPRELVRTARLAEERGFDRVWISDHYHPWIDRQGQSPFVWSVIGAVASSTGLTVGTGVTCPIMRIHPAIIAQAAATSAVMAEGRFFLGVGTGEALNETILGDRWPPAPKRLAMLEEAVDVLRLLWQGGVQSHDGEHFVVENARIYTLPERPPPIYMSAFGPKATEVAARIADGFVTTAPSADAVTAYREAGGSGPVLAGAKVCWGPEEDKARDLAFEMWPNMGLPGELAQILPTPNHFEQAVQSVDRDTAVGSIPCGPDVDLHVDGLRAYAEAGFDEVYIQQIGHDQEQFLDFYAEQVLPRL